MLNVPPTMRVFLANQPTDMRRSFGGLVALTRSALLQDPLSRNLFAFVNRRRTMMKAVYWDRNGYCLVAKRLEKGTFVLPAAPAGSAIEVEADPILPVNNDPDQSPKPPKPRKPRLGGRRPLPAHLEREQIRLVPTADQVQGKGPMHKVGEQSSEVLDYVPAHFKVLHYVRETWSNASGEIVTAPAPNKIIDKGIPGPGLLTQVVLSKYRDHCPLARQTRIYARSGVQLRGCFHKKEARR